MIHTDDKVTVTKYVPDGYARFVGETGTVLDVSDDGFALVDIFDKDADNFAEVPFHVDHLVLASDPVSGPGWAEGVTEEYKAEVRKMYADNPQAMAILDAADGKTEELDDATLELFRLLANAAADAAGVDPDDSDALEAILDAIIAEYRKAGKVGGFDIVVTCKTNGG